jgi:hypothetical protein
MQKAMLSNHARLVLQFFAETPRSARTPAVLGMDEAGEWCARFRDA